MYRLFLTSPWRRPLLATGVVRSIRTVADFQIQWRKPRFVIGDRIIVLESSRWKNSRGAVVEAAPKAGGEVRINLEDNAGMTVLPEHALAPYDAFDLAVQAAKKNEEELENRYRAGRALGIGQTILVSVIGAAVILPILMSDLLLN